MAILFFKVNLPILQNFPTQFDEQMHIGSPSTTPQIPFQLQISSEHHAAYHKRKKEKKKKKDNTFHQLKISLMVQLGRVFLLNYFVIRSYIIFFFISGK